MNEGPEGPLDRYWRHGPFVDVAKFTIRLRNR